MLAPREWVVSVQVRPRLAMRQRRAWRRCFRREGASDLLFWFLRLVIFEFLHFFYRVLVCAGKDGAELAEFGAGLEASPLEELYVFAGKPFFGLAVFEYAEAELLPDFAGGFGDEWVEMERQMADGLGGVVENLS